MLFISTSCAWLQSQGMRVVAASASPVLKIICRMGMSAANEKMLSTTERMLKNTERARYRL